MRLGFLSKAKRIHFFLIILLLCLMAFPLRMEIRSSFIGLIQILRGRKTVSQQVRRYQNDVEARLAPLFAGINVKYPPEHIVLLALKNEKLLEVWVADEQQVFHHLKTYPILAASGGLGPKLTEGDAQVPEGLYQVESLNPNSLYHLALRLNFPNDFDLARAALDMRKNVGKDIMIHGKNCSVGCLAMGDPAIEDLFVLAALAGIENVSVIISPVDFRASNLPQDTPQFPDWTPALYEQIKEKMAELQEKEDFDLHEIPKNL